MKFFYTVGHKKFYNKLEAIKENLNTGDPIRFITPYDDFDFSIEPESTLQKLISDHLTELRSTYKQIKLYYSGGSDSHFILESILSNKIYVDEIVCLKSGIPGADYEIEDYAEPFLKKHRDKLRNTKISIKTLSIDDYRRYYKKGVTKEKIQSGAVGIHNYFRLFWPLDIFGQESKQDVLHITGAEKPEKNIIKHGEDYYMYLIDLDLEPHINNYQFYSSDNSIQNKEAHRMLQNHRTKETPDVKRYTAGQPSPPKRLFLEEANNYIEHKGIKLYYHNDKEKVALQWSSEHAPDLIQLWHENLEQLKDYTENKWWNYGRPEMSSIGVLSNFYCLTKKDVKTVDDLFPHGFKKSTK